MISCKFLGNYECLNVLFSIILEHVSKISRNQLLLFYEQSQRSSLWHSNKLMRFILFNSVKIYLGLVEVETTLRVLKNIYKSLRASQTITLFLFIFKL